MERKNNQKWLKWAVGLLIVLNLGLLWTVWRITHRPMFPNEPRRVEAFLIHELQLSEAQTKQFQASRDKHFRRTKETIQHIRTLKRELMEMMATGGRDTLKTEPIVRSIGEKQMNLERLILTHYAEMEAICTPEQRLKLRKLFQEGALRPPAPTGGGRGRFAPFPPPQ